jgi:nucleoside-diphosphate-sugar epimerase
LVSEAEKAGVKKILFLSSIGVHGRTMKGQIEITEKSKLAPYDFYTKSKLEAGKKLIDFCNRSEIDYVILRPPLIYGLGAKGGIQRIIQITKYFRYLPFKSIKNSQSFISVDLLSKIIEFCATENSIRNQVYICSDKNPMSTPQLISKLAELNGIKLVLFPLNVKFLKFILNILRLSNLRKQLLEDYIVNGNKLWKDIKKARNELE